MMALLLLSLKLMLENEQQVKRNHILIFLIQKRISTVLLFALCWKLLGRGWWCDGEAGIFRPVAVVPAPARRSCLVLPL